MTTTLYEIKCVKCGNTFDEKDTTTRCLDCGEALDVIFNHDELDQRVERSVFTKNYTNSSHYTGFYPFKEDTNYISLNEGGTPLIKLKNIAKKYNLKNLYAKNEGANPTGVFKDRGSLVEITKAVELGAKGICCASTGNMAASVSAYAAAAGLPSYVFVPEGTPIGKLSQSLAYGAKVISIRGTYADCCEICEEVAKSQGFYLAGDYAFRGEGQKSLSYEVIQQLDKVPDYVIVPMGCGTNISAIYKGFKEMKDLGITDRVPKMVGVQPSAVPTIVQAFHEGKKNAINFDKAKSVASAVGIGKPLDGIKALEALYESEGLAIEIDEKDILEAQYELSHEESLFIEPSSALSFAALAKMNLKEDDVVVGVLTGTGLKDPVSITKLMPEPHVLEPNIDEVNKYFDRKLYEITSSKYDKEDILWLSPPEDKDLKALIKKEFNIDLEKDYLDEIARQIELFHEKTNQMKRADLEYIIQNVLREYHGEEKTLEVKDFEVHINQHRKPLAWVKAEFEGKMCEAHAQGVGPVDAILAAVKNTIAETDKLNTKLTNYNVEINTGGTDAVVEVRLNLVDQFGLEVIGSATSPDVIVASISAFEKAYNILHYKQKKKGNI